MTLINSYLTQGKVKRVLARRPGEAGFSLIELVVVVAVLAILSAIAIPSFTSINNKARASAASNTLATIIKECAVKEANGIAAPQYTALQLDGYNPIVAGACPTTVAPTITVSPTAANATLLPAFTYNVTTGAKTCTPNVQNCTGGVW